MRVHAAESGRIGPTNRVESTRSTRRQTLFEARGCLYDARMRLLAFLIAASSLTACADDVDWTGTYTVNVRNEANRCTVSGWTEGETASGIPVEFSQSGDNVDARVGGSTGILFNTLLGEDTFMGLADGDEVEMTIYGTRSVNDGDCTFTYTVTTNATLDGDVISGAIDYRPDTNGSPSCGVRNDCSNRQTFNGSRAPTSP